MFKSHTLLRKMIPLLALALFAGRSSAQVWIEDFDGSNGSVTTVVTPAAPCYASRDYFDIVCVSGAGCPQEMNGDYGLTNSSGHFFGARDMDSAPCSAPLSGGSTLSFTGIDISSCLFPSVSYVCFSVAESQNQFGGLGAEWSTSNMREDTWDGSSSVQVRATVDGVGPSQVTALEASNNSDSRPGVDVNCDAKADDPGEPLLTDVFTNYCFELPANGASLDLELEFFELNTGGEDIQIDDIGVYCTTDPTTLPGTLLDACTPFVANDPILVWEEDFDGSNAIAWDFGSCVRTDSRDYFAIVCETGCSGNMNGDYFYNGTMGNFLGARDINGNPCGTDLPVDAEVVGVDISSCSDALYICFDIAESDTPREGTDTWDGMQSETDRNSVTVVSTTIDGSGPTVAGAFTAASNNNSGPAADFNLDIIGEGTAVTSTFSTFCYSLGSTGTAMDITVTVGGLNTDGDDIAIDNIRVLCTSDVNDLPVAPVTGSSLALSNYIAAVLPVEYNFFDGKMTALGSQLSWQTASEINSDYFEIQYSTNGQDFKAVALMDASGTTQEVNTYSYLHEDVGGTINYYRLKQVDYDGAYDYSETIRLKREDKEQGSSIYPNPTKDQFYVSGDVVSLHVYSMTGQMMLQESNILVGRSIDITSLDRGLYLVQITDSAGLVSVEKLLVQ